MLGQSAAASTQPIYGYALGEYIPSEGGYFFASEGAYGYVFADPSTELFLDYFGAPDGSGSALIPDFGAGASNTETLITINGLYTDVLAYVVDYTGGGKTDWFVGSYNEIVRAYEVAIETGFSFPVANPTYPTLATSTASTCGSSDLQIRSYLRQINECMDRSGNACYGWPIRRFGI